MYQKGRALSDLSFDRFAVAYDQFTGRWTRAFVPALLRAAAVRPGQRVLDLAGGTGESTLLVADAVGASGGVINADISLPMLRLARAKIDGRPIRLAAMDGQALACRPASFDVVACQFGLMFFPDPAAGVREARRALRAGGRFVATVWGTSERVPWLGALADGLSARFPDRDVEIQRGLSLGDPARLARVLQDGGLRDVTVTAETQPVTFESFADYWRHVESGAIRIAQMVRELAPEEAGALQTRLRERFAPFAQGDRLVMPTTAFVAAGTA